MTPNERIKARLAAAAAAKKGGIVLAPPPVAPKAPATAPAPAVSKPTPTPAPTIVTPTANLAASNRAAVVQMDKVGENGEYAPFKELLLRLANDLDAQVPDYHVHLREAYLEMSKDPNVVTVMTDDEIGLIVTGLARHRDVTVVTQKKGSTRKTQPLDLDDI